MKIKAKIYPDDASSAVLKGLRAPYFYTHGKLEKDVGYDCCNLNKHAMQEALSAGICLVKIETNRLEAATLGLMFTFFGRYGMEARIVYINDLVAIKQVLSNAKLRIEMESSQKQYLWHDHIETHDLIYKSL